MQNQKTVVHVVIMFDQYQLLVHISNNYGISVRSLIGTSLLNIHVYIIVLGNNIMKNIRKIHCTCTCTYQLLISSSKYSPITEQRRLPVYIVYIVHCLISLHGQ